MGVDKVTERHLDLLVIDYGGVLPGTDMPMWQIREALRWAEEHPSSLLYLYTTHTRRIYEYELKDQFGHLENVDYRYDSDPRGEEIIQRVRLWLGIAELELPSVEKLKVPGRQKEG